MKLPKVSFKFDRKHRSSNTVKGGIDMRITFGSEQKFISTGIRCLPGQWNEKREETVNMLEAKEYNEILAKMRLRAVKAINAMIDDGRFDLNMLAASMKNGQNIDMTFEQYILKRMRERQVTDYTKKAYHVFFSRFSAWGGMRFFADVTEKGVRNFDEYLHAFRWNEKDRFGKEVEKRYSQATIGSMHKNLKVFIGDAMVDGYVKENPYSTKKIKIDKGSTRIDQFLTVEEVEKIEKAEMPTKSLSEAKDLFLIQVYTGLSYVDLMSYDFTKCRDAEFYDVFSGYRSKTGVLFTFVFTEKAKAILDKYDYVVPKIPNQKYNVKLKLVGDAAGIDQGLTSHTGRRSCGYILLNAGVPISVVSRILGHSSVRQTEQAYARLLDSTIAEEIRKHIK